MDLLRNGTGKTLVSPSTATAKSASAEPRRDESIMANIESARFDWFGQDGARLLIDVRTQFAFHYRIHKSKDFALRAGNLHLNSAVRKIADPANHIKSFGDIPDGPPKTDPLDVAFVKNLERDHAEPEILNR